MRKVGDKFIVEIGEICVPDCGLPAIVGDEELLYRIKGFKSLVLDEHGLRKLEKPLFGGEADYKKALDEASMDSYKEGYDAGFDAGVTAGKLAADGKSYADGLADGKKEFHEYDYQNGLDKAWAAIKILLDRDDRKEYNFEFAGLTANEIVRQFPVDEVIARLKTQLDSTFLNAGNEVEIGGKKVVVTRVPEDDPGRFCYIDREGRTYTNNAYAEFKKTGRHFPIADLLKQMEAPDERN
jgi:hypothetical protein